MSMSGSSRYSSLRSCNANLRPLMLCAQRNSSDGLSPVWVNIPIEEVTPDLDLDN